MPVQGSWQGGGGVPPWYGGIGTGNDRLELAKRMLARLQAQAGPQVVARRRIKNPSYVAPPVPTLDEIVAGIPASYKPPQPGMSPAMQLLNRSLGRQLYPGQGGQYWSWANPGAVSAPVAPVVGGVGDPSTWPAGPNNPYNNVDPTTGLPYTYNPPIIR